MNTEALDIYPFEEASQQVIFKHLTQSLRCVVCQNQTLAESYAPVAVQLRDDIYRRVQLKQSEEDILALVVQEYGAFVAYKPPFVPLTWGLWLGPFLMLALGIGMVYKYTIKKRHST